MDLRAEPPHIKLCWVPSPAFRRQVSLVKKFLLGADKPLTSASFHILGDPGADSGCEGKSKREGKYGTKKSKERRVEPLGTMSYQTSSKRSPPFWLLIGARKTQVFWHQSEARTAATVGTGLVRHCPQGLFSPFFTFLRAIFFIPFRLSLARTICPWVSEDVLFNACIHSLISPNFNFFHLFRQRT